MLAAVASLGLGGCMGLPPAVSVASLAADGVSWLTSGKTVTDHAVSEVAGQDCRLIGLVEDGQVCKTHPAYAPTQVATLTPLAERDTRVAEAPAQAPASTPDSDDPARFGGRPGPAETLPRALTAAVDRATSGATAAGLPGAAAGLAPITSGRGFTGNEAPDPLGLGYASAGLGGRDTS